MSVTCRACTGVVERLLNFGLQPIVNDLQVSPNTEVARYPMRVGGCTDCGLVQMLDLVPAEPLYTNYSTPSSWKSEPHLERLIFEMEGMLTKSSRVIDVGCNDGKFLRVLQERGWTNLFGIEPGANTSLMAQEAGLQVLHGYLDLKRARALVSKHGHWDCVVLRSVLEHVGELREFGEALNVLLRDGGVLAMEVPDLQVNVGMSDYTLWEEHVNYFSEESLNHYLEEHGFRIQVAYRSLFSGIMLSVVAVKVAASGRAEPVHRGVASTSGAVNSFRGWASDFPSFQSRVRETISSYAAQGTVALFGVGNRSSLFLNLMGIAQLVDVAFDDQPAKQGTFLPVSGIPVRPGSEIALISDLRLVLLGVNGESEDAVLRAYPLLSRIPTYSILPPSPRLLPAWPATSLFVFEG